MSTTYQTNLDSINHYISISDAHDLIARFKTNRPSIIRGDFVNADPFTVSQTFNDEAVLDLLGQEGCIGLRAYFGMYDSETSDDKKGKIVLVLCGVDEDGNDLNLAVTSTSTGQIILEDGQPCPPICSAPSKINNL